MRKGDADTAENSERDREIDRQKNRKTDRHKFENSNSR